MANAFGSDIAFSELLRMNEAEVDDIRREMGEIRAAIVRDADAAVRDARTLADWRHHFRSHPWLFCGSAAAIAYLLVPHRKPDTAAQVVEHAGLHLKQSEAARPSSWGTLAFGWASTYLAKQALEFATSRGREWVEQHTRRRPTGDQTTSVS